MRYRGHDGVGVRASLLALGGAGATLLAVAAVALAAHYEGTSGDDSITAEHGSSTAYLRGGNDTFVGAPGNDGGADHVWGSPGTDDITGRKFSDLLRGGSGNDRLDGGTDQDELRGGPGDDLLIGGGGRDLPARRRRGHLHRRAKGLRLRPEQLRAPSGHRLSR